MDEQDLALSNLKWLIYHETNPNLKWNHQGTNRVIKLMYFSPRNLKVTFIHIRNQMEK